MSWQEELRNLDEELASGRLSADDYRLRRDQVLSSAVAYGDPAQQQGAPQQPAQPPQAPQQYQQPYQPQQPPQYQQPPQQQEPQPSADSTQIIAPVSPPHGTPAQSNPAPSAEATQIVSAADTGGERTQVVPGWQQQQQPMGDPSRTQVVPGQPSPAGGFPQQGPASPSGGFQQPQQPWNAPDADLSPPWGGSDFPPISPVGSSEWVKQGPELFDDKPKGKGGKIAILVIVAILVLGGLGVGGFFLFKGDGNTQADNGPTNQPSQSQAAPAPTTSKPPPTPEELLFEQIPEQSGDADPKSGAIPVAQLAALTGLEPGEIDLITAAGVNKVAVRSSQKQPDDTGPQPAKINVVAIPLTSPGGALELAKQLRQYQGAHGFVLISDPLPGMPPKLNFQKKISGDNGTYRGTWISGNNLMIVDVAQNPLGGEDGEKALSGTYQRAVKKTLDNFTVTG